jgi:hypothetical protein
MNSGNRVSSIRFTFLSWKLILVTLILLVTVPARPSPIQHARLRLVVQVSELSNLIYQLDCLSGLTNCSQNSYLHLWRSTLDWSAEDQSQLEQWKLLRAKYHGPIPLNQPQFQPANLPWNGPTGLQLDEKFSIAALHAVDEKSLWTHWEVIVAPTDLPKLESIVGYFQPRFSVWWSHRAQEKAEEFKRDLQNRLQQEPIQALLESFARFYDADFPDGYPVYLNLFFRPPGEDTHSNATMIENHAVIEFIPGEDVNRHLRVVIHELCHFLYSSSTDSQKQRLISAFANSKGPSSLAGWGLLNEALATALGNGIAGECLSDSATYNRELQTERSFYNDATIDAAAKALIPFLQTQISDRKTLYDSNFVGAYLTSLESEIPALLMMPARLFTEVTIIYGREFGDAFQHEIRPQLSGGIYPFAGLENGDSWVMHERYPKLNAIVFVSPKTLPLLKRVEKWVAQADFQSMERASERGGPWVYAVQRFPSTYLFVIYGQSNQDDLHELLSAHPLVPAGSRKGGRRGA